MKEGQVPYVLGLDLGVASVGWAALEMRDKKPQRLLRAGVRVFDAGMENFESGKGESPNVARRDARQLRRMTERRARRLKRLRILLQDAGLLPPDIQDETIHDLDREILRRRLTAPALSGTERARLPQVLPYWLRARALDERLEPFELGRALYHLGQRRGFLSNRKAPPKKKEEDSVVKESIGELRQSMQEQGARTLGEYFSRLDPTLTRIRQRWTARDMFKDEFEKIWRAQTVHHAALTEALQKQIEHAIFFQRPLKSVKGLIGVCEFEPDRHRAPMALLCAQRFRLLQQVNHCRLITPDGELRPLTEPERALLIGALEKQKTLTFTQAKKLLGFKRNYLFTLEEGGEAEFKGNATAAALSTIFGARWNELSPVERDQVVEDWRSIQKAEALYRRGLKHWKLTEEQAQAFAELELPGGYSALSRQAIQKLLPHLEKGLSYMESVQAVEEYRRTAEEPLALLPPVDEALPHLRNPAVHRVLTELRKVVNTLIREQGKPERIRVELARDLRKSSKERQESWKRGRYNEKLRKAAAEKLLAEMHMDHPRATDIEKVLLWQECRGTCPYTGKQIPFQSLFGMEPQFDTEHIVPFSRSLDNSFFNKTLCCVRENRAVKGNKTPWEAYGANADRWNDILGRVGRFDGQYARVKLERFKNPDVQELTDDFATNQLNDTRYASKLAVQYLALLYGGISDAEGKKRVAASKGGVTKYLRDEWRLTGILGDPDADRKSRDDHRHHAVDAVVIGLTDEGAVKALSDAARRAPEEGRRRFAPLPPPWPTLAQDVRASMAGMHVSHRPSHKVSGALHEETFYGQPRTDADGKTFVHVRKKLESLKPNDVNEIVDERVRECVRVKLAELGDIRKFQDAANHPVLPTCDGRHIPIHKVRLRRRMETLSIGDERRRRYVTHDSNQHMEIIEVTKNGKIRWEGVVVSRYEAVQRLHRREPVVRRDHGEGRKLLFTIAPGDILDLDYNGGRMIARIRSVSRDMVEFVAITDARKKTDIDASDDWHKVRVGPLAKRNVQKVIIGPLGNVRRAGD